MVPGQEAKNDNLGFFLIHSQYLYIECTHKNPLDKAMLMSTHNIQFHDKIRNFP